jgi:hypothetical protein
LIQNSLTDIFIAEFKVIYYLLNHYNALQLRINNSLILGIQLIYTKMEQFTQADNIQCKVYKI